MKLATPLLVGATVFLLAAAPVAKEASPGAKVLAYAQQHKGEQVGNGECAVLATEALKAADAKRRGPDKPDKGDYTWGKLVYTVDATAKTSEGKATDVGPGDIVQFRDAKFSGRKNRGTYRQSFPHHTAIVSAVEDDGATIRFLHQNHNGNKTVQDATLTLADLKEGWLRFYQPLPK